MNIRGKEDWFEAGAKIRKPPLAVQQNQLLNTVYTFFVSQDF